MTLALSANFPVMVCRTDMFCLTFKGEVKLFSVNVAKLKGIQIYCGHQMFQRKLLVNGFIFLQNPHQFYRIIPQKLHLNHNSIKNIFNAQVYMRYILAESVFFFFRAVVDDLISKG